MLVTRTTHMKASFIRKNGPPSSDRATMTNRFYRHGNFLTLVAVIEDPIYLSEPLIWTRDFQVSPTRLTPIAPPLYRRVRGNDRTGRGSALPLGKEA